MDENGKLVPMRLKNRPMQKHFIETVVKPGHQKAIELKARRVGGTSLFMALGLVRTMTRKNYKILLLAQSDPDAQDFMKFGFRAFYDNMVTEVDMPDGTRFMPRVPLVNEGSTHEMIIRNGSLIQVGTAGSLKLKRGQAFDMIIGTEVARWDVNRPVGTAEETWAMALGASGDKPNILAIQESTAYGAGGFFYDTYTKAKNGENGFIPLFYNWTVHPAYRYPEGDLRAMEEFRGPLELDEREQLLGITEEQARWRRTAMATLGESMFLQEYPEDDETCFRVSGSPYFDIDVVDKSIKSCRPVLSTSESGQLKIWQAPRVGERYIVGMDPGGEGVERTGSHERDYDAIGVFDSRMNHCATLHGRWDTQEAARLACDLARWYNNALMIVETGPYGNAVLLAITAVLGYKNVYYEKDQRGRPVRVGKLTSKGSKQGMLDNLKTVVEQGILRSDDKKFWEEMRNFHRMPTNTGTIKLQARAGHDDLVMMAALAAWAWHEGNFGRHQSHATRIHIPGRKAIKSEFQLGPKPNIEQQKADLLRRLGDG